METYVTATWLVFIWMLYCHQEAQCTSQTGVSWNVDTCMLVGMWNFPWLALSSEEVEHDVMLKQITCQLSFPACLKCTLSHSSWPHQGAPYVNCLLTTVYYDSKICSTKWTLHLPMYIRILTSLENFFAIQHPSLCYLCQLCQVNESTETLGLLQLDYTQHIVASCIILLNRHNCLTTTHLIFITW